MGTSANAVLARSQSAPESGRTSRARHIVALAYLRTFAVILVLAHHTSLAYFPKVPLTRTSLLVQPRLWKAFPILDSHRWTGFAVFAAFNDMFFMSLLFFLSGLFVWSSLERKGTRTFMRDRMLRLALPFIFALVIVAPLAYYPAYATRNADPSVAGFLRQWLSLGEWPTGPAWFIWVLLVFDCVAAALFVKWPKFGERLGRLASNANRHPARFFLLLIGMSALVYIPMVIPLGRGFLDHHRPVSIPEQPHFSLRGLFFHGCRRRRIWPRARPARARWNARAALAAMDYRDTAGVHTGRGLARRRGMALAYGAADRARLDRRPAVAGVVRGVMFRFPRAVRALREPADARARQPERQRIRDVLDSLRVRVMARIRDADRATAGGREVCARVCGPWWR